jgi:beta-xylosidase
MLLRRQTSYDGTWTTRIKYEPADEWEEAGTVVYYSKWSYIAIVVRKNKDGKKEILARWTEASEDKATKVCPAHPPSFDTKSADRKGKSRGPII